MMRRDPLRGAEPPSPRPSLYLLIESCLYAATQDFRGRIEEREREVCSRAILP